jgi:hypothetical protein
VSTYTGTVAIYDPVFFCRLLGWRGLPHEALDVRCPAELYTVSTRPHDGLPELTYPFRDVLVTADGSAFAINISTALAKGSEILRPGMFRYLCVRAEHGRRGGGRGTVVKSSPRRPPRDR